MQLITASSEHMYHIKSWFGSFDEIYTWGGPRMVYPISEPAFLSLLQAPELSSYVLLDNNAQVLAFGQHYLRLQRHHLGRLVVNPIYRGKGLGQVLVKKLLDVAIGLDSAESASLFVFKNNLAAYHCYQKLEFVETEYPGGIPGNMQNCVYMVRPFKS